MLNDRALTLLGTGDCKTNIVLLVGPIDADERGEHNRRFLQVDSFRSWWD
jgi:hypothetical protein